MMNEHETVKTLEQKMKYLFIARDKTVLEEQVKVLKDMVRDIKETKEEFIAKQDEDNANKWFSIENVCSAILNGLFIFVGLKENDPSAAWNSLIFAQNRAHDSIVAYRLPDTSIQRNCFKHFSNIEHVIFPPQSFTSDGSIVSKSICSICQKEILECDHIKGEVYMGKMCSEIVVDIQEVKEISIVADPASKIRRVLNYTENSITVDTMTLLTKPASKIAN